MTEPLMDLGFSHDLAVLIAKTLGVLVVATFGLLWTILGIWIERKVAGRVQDRLGPNRVGPYGVFQTIADAIKILLKEDLVPEGADRWVYNLAPILSVMSVLLLWPVIPFSKKWVGTDLRIGVLYLFAAGALGSLAVLMAGWASNNKYALLGAFRGVAMLISYEVPLALAMLIPVLLSGSLSVQGVIAGQHIWYVFAVPLTVVIFVISSLAELGRAPFDLTEAESEIVAGYHIEYSGMKFGMFYVGEFLHAFTTSVLVAVLFMGGWRGPLAGDILPLGFVYLLLKSLLVYFVIMWVRMTLPRVRIDQLLDFNWKFLVPLSLINLLVVSFLWKLVPDTDTITSFADALLPTLVLLSANIILTVGALTLARGWGRRVREKSAVGPAGSGD